MTILLNKSKESIEASEFLKNENLFASSVHCSYYSCIQLMRHILFNIQNEDENTFDNGQNINQAGSHNYLLSILTNDLKNHEIDIRTFRNQFRNIKDLRKNADYKQLVILEIDCNNAYNLALKINRTLKNIYSI